VERTVTRKRKWNVWTGTTEELNRIAAEFESQARARRDAALAAFNADQDQEDVAIRLERWASKYTPTAEVDYGSEVVKGSYDEVMESFDRRTYSEIRLAVDADNPLGRDALKLDLGRYRGRDPQGPAYGARFPSGVSLEIKSSDPNWALQAFAQLSNEIDKGQPWWRWIHTGAGVMFFYVALALALAVSLYPLFAQIWTEYSPRQLTGLAVATGVLVFGICVVFEFLPKLLPPVEILAEGSTATGTRVIIFIVGVIVIPVAITVLSNLAA
jgi:hypothetical protein